MSVMMYTQRLFLSFPEYDLVLFNRAKPLAKALNEGLLHQLHNLYSSIRKEYLDKRAFQITIPVIASLLHIGTSCSMILQHITGVFLYNCLITAVSSLCQDRTLALLTALGFAATFVGVGSCHNGSCYDGVAYFLLVSKMTLHNAWWGSTSVLLASFSIYNNGYLLDEPGLPEYSQVLNP